MAHLGETFDPDSVEPRESIEPVPAGEYVAEIIESDVVDLKSGKGRGVKLTLKIVEGQLEGRRIWDQINYRHENEVAQKIGQQTLAELCSACGIRGPLEDTEHLHGNPIRVRVAIETDKSGNYCPRNVVKKYGVHDHASAPAPRQAPARQDPPASSPPKAASGGAMPWRR